MPLKINGSVNIIQGPGFAKHFLQFFSSSSRHEVLRSFLRSFYFKASQMPRSFLCSSYSGKYTFSFYKKLGSGHSTKSFLSSHEILSILVLKVSELVSYFLNAELAMWSLTLRQICFLTFKTS